MPEFHMQNIRHSYTFNKMQPVVVVVNNNNNVMTWLATHYLQTYLKSWWNSKEIRKLDVCSFWRKIRELRLLQWVCICKLASDWVTDPVSFSKTDQTLKTEQLGDRFGSESEFWHRNAFVDTPFDKSTAGLLLSRTAELCKSFQYCLKYMYRTVRIESF